MSHPIAFISHSSEDKGIARALVKSLGSYNVDSWIDEEEIRFGDSVPSKIADGLSNCDVILILVSKHFIASSWCRAEYEALLTKEINTGRIAVIPIRLDNSEMPVLLAAKRYVDFRSGIGCSEMEELAKTIKKDRSFTKINRLLPKKKRSYECSVISMIISNVIHDFPVSEMNNETLLEGKSLLDLYKTISTFIEKFQELCDEIIKVLIDSNIKNRFYGSAFKVTQSQLQLANRKLLGIAADMRDISKSFNVLLSNESNLRRKFSILSEVCTSISIAEDFLVIKFGTPVDLPNDVIEHRPIASIRDTHEIPNLPIYDNGHGNDFPSELGEQMVNDFNKVLLELSDYKRQLRNTIAQLQ